MGTQTINTTSEQDARLVVAFGKELSLTDENGDPRDATGAEVKTWLINKLRKVVRGQEMKVKKNAITVSDFNPT